MVADAAGGPATVAMQAARCGPMHAGGNAPAVDAAGDLGLHLPPLLLLGQPSAAREKEPGDGEPMAEPEAR
jgi:hypothetical protein